MKNKKIVTIFSITIFLLILSIIVKPNYPEEYKPNSISSIGEITGNTIINQNFKSKLDVLDSIKIQYGTYTKKIESGSLNIKIYNGSKEIYQHEYQLNELSDNQIYKAFEIVTTLFERNLDKGGMPYILHLIYVYRHVSTEREKVVGLLHDTIEDKDVSKEDLLEVGFAPEIVEDVVNLTRVKPIEYNDYIDNLIKNGSVEALRVKQADLEHNMDISRIKNPSVKEVERVKYRYIPTYEKIKNRLEEIENDRHKAY